MLKSALSSPLYDCLFDALYADDTPVFLLSNIPMGASINQDDAPVDSSWILATGDWNDSGIWQDNQNWID